MNATASKRPLVQCEAVGLRFANREVIRNFNLQVFSGDRIAFLGPSGCGKSTLLNLISGLLSPTSGRVNRNLEAEKISFVFQEPSLIPWKTVRENLELVGDLISQSENRMNDLLLSLLHRVGLSDRENSWPDELSGGMKMRVALARALVNSPHLILLDEPFSALDDVTRTRLQDDILALQRESAIAYILVTHNIEEAVRMCDRILVFSRSGELLKDDDFNSGVDTKSMDAAQQHAERVQKLRDEVRQAWSDVSTEGVRRA
ncbi:ABC transporter ATP-binding protein [bacterium]|nr:ABC transporter ATP-binding protein [bacterium]